MTSDKPIPNNATSYDTGNKPFQPDATRGKWANIWDFYAAILSQSIGIRNFCIFPVALIVDCGIFFVIPCTVGLLIFAIPVFFIQSFLGQFSSSGFISAFRISPLFKGIGYVILALNLTSASYFSVKAAMPLTMVFASFNKILPWMRCDNSWNTNKCTETYPGTLSNESDFEEYFHSMRNKSWSVEEYLDRSLVLKEFSEWHLSWRIFLCTILVWIALGFLLRSEIETIGIVFRYLTITLFIFFLIIFIRILCLSGTAEVFEYIFVSSFRNASNPGPWLISPVILFLTFGSGWGTILTIASYNDFKDNIGKHSVIICISHAVIMYISAIAVVIANDHLEHNFNFTLFHFGRYSNEFVFLEYPYLFGNLEMPQLWIMIFYMMLFLGEFAACAIQLLSVLTAIFDEFEILRIYKTELTMVMLGTLGCSSLIYSFNQGSIVLSHMYNIASLTQLLICFCQLMVVVWIYGRLRFQRDVQFMLGKTYASWKIWILRFITPFFLFVIFCYHLLFSFWGAFIPGEYGYFFLGFTLKMGPLLAIPIYIVIKLFRSTGTLKNRFKFLCRPTDWYPVDPNHHQNYNSFIASSDISEQLVI